MVVKKAGATRFMFGFMSSSSFDSYPSTRTVELELLSVIRDSWARETDFTPGSAAMSSWRRWKRVRRRGTS